ncbi:hypothetical protein MKEN_00767000 [Mycena kentingensis (nom. inval.)]|nr:hypothetical protein MKEN_00767000 [Mycena kentingensis (nom. inval.)]
MAGGGFRRPLAYTLHATGAIAQLFLVLVAISVREPVVVTLVQQVVSAALFLSAPRYLSPPDTRTIRAPLIFSLVALPSSYLLHLGIQPLFGPKQAEATIFDLSLSITQFLVRVYVVFLDLVLGFLVIVGGLPDSWAFDHLSPRTLRIAYSSFCIIFLTVVPTVLVFIFINPAPFFTFFMLYAKACCYVSLATFPWVFAHNHEVRSDHSVSAAVTQVVVLVASTAFCAGQLGVEPSASATGPRYQVDTGYVVTDFPIVPVLFAVEVCNIVACGLALSFSGGIIERWMMLALLRPPQSSIESLGPTLSNTAPV